MALKKAELTNPMSCLNRAAGDEPVFVLRAKDAFAAQAVRHWATMAEGTHEPEKIGEARQLAAQMDEWRRKREIPALTVTSPTPDVPMPRPPVAPMCIVKGCGQRPASWSAYCVAHIVDHTPAIAGQPAP